MTHDSLHDLHDFCATLTEDDFAVAEATTLLIEAETWPDNLWAKLLLEATLEKIKSIADGATAEERATADEVIGEESTEGVLSPAVLALLFLKFQRWAAEYARRGFEPDLAIETLASGLALKTLLVEAETWPGNLCRGQVYIDAVMQHWAFRRRREPAQDRAGAAAA